MHINHIHMAYARGKQITSMSELHGTAERQQRRPKLQIKNLQINFYQNSCLNRRKTLHSQGHMMVS
jgi:hypothetical protein